MEKLGRERERKKQGKRADEGESKRAGEFVTSSF